MLSIDVYQGNCKGKLPLHLRGESQNLLRMSWFQSSGIAHLAKNALTSAQKTIDRALDIHIDAPEIQPPSSTANTKDETENFFAAFGIGTSLSKSANPSSVLSEKKLNEVHGSLWGSFSGSFFDSQNSSEPVVHTDGIEPVQSPGTKKEIVNIASKEQNSSFQSKEVDELQSTSHGNLPHDRASVDNILSNIDASHGSSELLQPVIIQQPSSGKSKSDINVKCEDSHSEQLSEGSFVNPVELDNSLEIVNKVLSVEIESKPQIDVDIPSHSESVISSNFNDQNIEETDVFEGKNSKSKETLSSISESTLVEVLEKSTDSSETIKDEGENETLVEESLNEKSFKESHNLPEIWEWESKLMATSESDNNSIVSVPIPVSSEDNLELKDSVKSIETESEICSKEVGVHLQLENLEESFVNVISKLENDQLKNESSTNSFINVNKEQEEDVEEFCSNNTSKVSEMAGSTENQSNSEKITESLLTVSSASNSFVTCMIEEAMGDQETLRSHSPHSTASSSEKSDMVKMESEQNSGHTSGDEVETTTSSDIEILSMSSPNGDTLERLSLSPIKQIWIGKPSHGSQLRRGDRAESPSSDTSSVRDSPMSHRPHSDKKFTPILLPSTSRDRKNYSNKFQGSKRRTEESNQSQTDVEILGQKLKEMTEILKARESKVIDLSRENIFLQEKNDTVTKQLQQVEQAHAADARDVTTLTEEFSQRLATMERNLQNALKEKETLKSELQNAKEELVNKVCVKEVEAMIKEKDTQIQELLQEGEKLSKQQLQHTNIIKKLRTKEKENESHIKQQKEKLEEQLNELERSRKALSAKEEIERKQIDAIRQLTNTVQKQEKEVSHLKSDLEDAQEKIKSMKSVLDTSYKELAELHRSNIEKESQVQEVVISAEITTKEEVRLALEKAQNDAKLEQEALVMQIEDLRSTLSRTEQQTHRREDALRQEILDEQEKLREAEARNQELTQNTSAASRPLLRQIENLQATFSSQSSAWEKVERNLTDRLNEARMQLSIITEKERSSAERCMELNTRLSSLEAQAAHLRQEKTRLQAEMETKNVKLEMLEEWKTKESVKNEMLKQSYADEISELKRELKILEHQLDIEKTVVEAEKRKNLLLMDQMKEKEKRNSQVIHQSSNRTTPSPTSSLSKFSSVSDSFNGWLQDENIEQNIMTSFHGNRLNLYDSLRHNGATSFLEGLQSQLKMKEGELNQLQNEISQLEKVRESMAQEMVRLSSQNEDLEEELKQLQGQQSKFQDMEQKYNALLQMYGEKVEEADELRLDLQDIKDMYKAQINDLLNKK